jgi:hypothetical protein
MHEGNSAPSRPQAWDFVYQTVSRRAAGLECRIEIWYPITDVVNAGASLGQEPPDGTIGAERRQQLHFGVAQRQGHDGCTIHLLWRVWLETQNVPVESQGRLEVGHGNANMGDVGAISHWSLPEQIRAAGPHNTTGE